jgi:hypothetical protein
VTLSGDILNISENGIYMATDYQMEYGTAIEISSSLPNSSV